MFLDTGFLDVLANIWIDLGSNTVEDIALVLFQLFGGCFLSFMTPLDLADIVGTEGMGIRIIGTHSNFQDKEKRPKP